MLRMLRNKIGHKKCVTLTASRVVTHFSRFFKKNTLYIYIYYSLTTFLIYIFYILFYLKKSVTRNKRRGKLTYSKKIECYAFQNNV